MYRKNKPARTTLRINKSVEGETIEAKVRRILKNGEPITDGAPIIFTERKDGIVPEYDIRTDRWEMAIEMTDQITAGKRAKRAERMKGPGEQPPGEAGKKE